VCAPVDTEEDTMKAKLCVAAIVAALSIGCGEIRSVTSSPVHELSLGAGEYLTISEAGTKFMVDRWFECKAAGTGDCACGTWALTITRDVVGDMIKNTAVRNLWGNTYGRGFANDQGCDFTQAVYDLDPRNHECLRIHYQLPDSSPNWTTVDTSVAQCKP
jgi:hypothetical protein